MHHGADLFDQYHHHPGDRPRSVHHLGQVGLDRFVLDARDRSDLLVPGHQQRQHDADPRRGHRPDGRPLRDQCPTGGDTLTPGASETCTATYTTTQNDVDAGSINNLGTATGTPVSGPKVTATSAVTIPALDTAAISLAKSASANSVSQAGTLVTYSYLVTNNGNVTLSGVGVSDPMSGLSAITCPVGGDTLSPGASETCTATYTVTQADLDAGSVTNTGTAIGTPPTGPTRRTQQGVDPGRPDPGSDLGKSTTKPTTRRRARPSPTRLPGHQLRQRDPDSTCRSPTPTSPLGTCTPAIPVASSAPGRSITCAATHTVTQADLDAGCYHQHRHATGTAADADTPTGILPLGDRPGDPDAGRLTSGQVGHRHHLLGAGPHHRLSTTWSPTPATSPSRPSRSTTPSPV